MNYLMGKQRQCHDDLRFAAYELATSVTQGTNWEVLSLLTFLYDPWVFWEYALGVIIILSYHKMKAVSHCCSFQQERLQSGHTWNFSASLRRKFQRYHQPYFASRPCPKGVPGPNSPFQRGNSTLLSCSATSPWTAAE